MILSLQGCMAVGKTTALRYVQEHAPRIHIIGEDNRGVIAEIRSRGLRQAVYEDYLEIQRLWLRHEVARYQHAKDYPCCVMDYGAEEIEFFTLHYPQSMGYDWEIESALADDLAAVRQCMPDRILFLDASDDVLIARRQGDPTRSRNSFSHHLTHLLPLKKQWFLGRNNVDLLNVDTLNTEEVGRQVLAWISHCLESK